MRSRDRGLIVTVGTCLALLAGAGSTFAQTTIALVPTVVYPVGKMFKLDTGSVAAFEFDLRPIPSAVTIQSVTLRLVHARSSGFAQNQAVRISSDAGPVGRLTVETAKPTAESLGTADGLLNTLRGALARGDATLTLSLSTRSPDTEFSYHSITADTARNRPRLIISWKDTAQPVMRVGAQLRYAGNPDDKTPWKNDAPTGAVLSRLGFGPGDILAGPVFRGDEILLIATTGPPDSRPTLYGLDWNGNQRWRLALPALGGGTWKYLHVDEQNRLLAFANDGTIRLFNDFGRGPPAAPEVRTIEGMLLSRRPAVSAGGMISFLNDKGYVYMLGPAPRFDELWRSDVNVGKAPPPVLSPRDGDDLVYVVDMPGKGLLAIDAARGDVRFSGAPSDGSPLSRYADVHRPLVVEGTEHDWVLLSGFGDGGPGGLLWGYTNFTAGSPDRWKAGKDGPVSRCVAPPATDDAGPVIYCVQGGKFIGFRRDGASHCMQPAAVEGLEATSNLVADGDGNVYFWNEALGRLYGFTKGCERFLVQGLQGLPTKADGSDFELRLGPDGVLYVASNTELFAIQPTRSGPLGPLVADTRYAVQGPIVLEDATAPTDGPVIVTAIGGELSLGNLQVPPGADVTCSAGSGVSLGRGFKVAKGGVLRCGIRAFVPISN